MNEWDRETWARTLWMETRGEPEDGRFAVAHVIWNRFQRSGKLRIAGVCMKDQAFSCWNAARDDSNREAMNALDMDDPLLEHFRSIVASVPTEATDPVDGATLYYSTTMPQP
ncbi:MAG: cell wall hydrolase, partial [Bauldia sp.]|nr:cell wall hydrolase [Bauldia sp.]